MDPVARFAAADLSQQPLRLIARLIAAFSGKRRTVVQRNASAAHSFTAFQPQAVHSVALRRHPPVKGRDRRGRAMEANVDIWTIGDLRHYTRDELRDLANQIEQALLDLEAGSAARTAALASLDNIRRSMVTRGLHF